MRSYLLAFALALVLSAVLSPLGARLGRALGAMDRTRDPPVPRAGGFAIFGATALALLLLALLSRPTARLLGYSVGLYPIGPRNVLDLQATYLGALGVLLLGLVDDLRPLRPAIKFGVEAAIAVGVFAAGLQIQTIFLSPGGELPLGPLLGLAFTVLWIVGITNAFNLLDGIDGAAAGAAIFALIAVFVTSIALENPLVALLAVTLAGATLGFLPYNFSPARIFLGDAGSLFLGFALAALAIRGAQKGTTLVAIAIPLVAFTVPVMDTVVAVVRRSLRGEPVMKGDRGHLHHRLLELGLTPRQAVAVLYVVCGAFALASVLLLNPNVRATGVVLFMIGAAFFVAVRYLKIHEFYELGRLARRGVKQTRALSFNVELRKAAQTLDQSMNWEDLVKSLARLFADSEFDRVRLTLQPARGSGRREYRLDYGQIVEEVVPVADDEWGVHLPFQVGREGTVQGELAVFRRYGRGPLLTDVNLLVDLLRPSLAEAASRVLPPTL